MMPESGIPLVFELARAQAGVYSVSEGDGAETGIPAEHMRNRPPSLPEISELDAVRHFTGLSQRNAGVDTCFYPLGSCTMKYNPRVNEMLAGIREAAEVHPLFGEESVQGALGVLWETQRWLGEISGFPHVTLQPSAGAQGEFGSLLIIRAYHRSRGRNPGVVLVPDTSHGTNPASAALCGFKVSQVKSGRDGLIDIEALRAALSDGVAALMITNPNTLGIFEKDIRKVADMVHAVGGLLYLDGANMNAMVGVTRPAAQGVDIMHFNLHKTFSAPHGGGGPGAGAIALTEDLSPFLPVPVVVREERDGSDWYRLDENRPMSIGRLTAFYGNFGIVVRAYAYLRRLGASGLARVARYAVLNANYLRKMMERSLPTAYQAPCMHEFVLSGVLLREKGVSTLDVAKRLLDYGFYAPTVYFPLIVEEAIMVEPTETESKATLEAFAEAFGKVVREDPDVLHGAPHSTPVGRLDEVKAARELILQWKE